MGELFCDLDLLARFHREPESTAKAILDLPIEFEFSSAANGATGTEPILVRFAIRSPVNECIQTSRAAAGCFERVSSNNCSTLGTAEATPVA